MAFKDADTTSSLWAVVLQSISVLLVTVSPKYYCCITKHSKLSGGLRKKWRLNGYYHQVDIQISHEYLEPHENSMHYMPHE